MANQYNLTVINESELTRPQFAVFATLPLKADYASINLAWLVQQIDATNRYTFSWEIEWAFVWAAEGARDGYTWRASGSLPADPTSQGKCAATFHYDGDFNLRPAAGPPGGQAIDGDTLWIDNTAAVPVPSVTASSVGVSLSGSPACVTNAGPNLQEIFTLHPTYYIDAGNYVHGQMVDGAVVTEFQVLEYADGTTDLTAVLNSDNTWTVS